MRILDNNTYRDMTEEEIEELFSDIQSSELDNKDNLTALAEGLSTANNMKRRSKSGKKYIRKRGKINERQNIKTAYG